MARHQIIYTSCMRGIDGVNDGQQIFSYDESFVESKSDEVKGLFNYQVPSLPPGTLMSEEIARTMPSSFMFRFLKNGNVAITLNTYLGRDYMGSAGRFGNHLSHSIVCDFSDFDLYPCEMYASTALRSTMEFEEVNSSEPPEYLPVPELTRGYVIDTDSIIEFLEIENHLEYYKKMVTALLRYSEEKRRIVICDNEENIVKWIAALHYTLPLEIAKTVNFTSYEYDPELSSSIICGVISEGTKYHVSTYMESNKHYVFDFINHQFSQVENNDDFMDFLDTVFSFSYDSLTEFHSFVIGKTTYREYGKGYYAAYYFYNLLTEGIVEINQEKFKSIVNFSSEYLSDSVRKELIDKLISERDNISRLDNEYALLVLGFMLKSINEVSSEQQRTIKQMIVDRLIVSISGDNISEKEFMTLYDSIDSMAREVHLSIPAELMVEPNRDSILSVLEQQGKGWKVLFIVRMICDYIKDMRISTEELYLDCNIGKIYSRIVGLMYSFARPSGDEVVELILSSFKEFPVYFVNMTFNLEAVMKDLSLSDADIRYLWKLFYDFTLQMDESSIDNVNSILLEYDRYDEMYQLFDRQIKTMETLKDARNYFDSYWRRWFVTNVGYGKTYATTAIKKYESVYEHKMHTVSDTELFQYAYEILHLAMKMEIREEYANLLCQNICEWIPMKNLSVENVKIINEMYQYQTQKMNTPVSGRLLLFWIAVQFGRVTSKGEILSVSKSIRSDKAKCSGDEFSEMSDGEIKDYFGWIFDSISKFSLAENDYVAIYQLFSFHERSQALFMEYWCKTTYKKSKGDKDYTDFAEFSAFMFDVGSLDNQDMVGKYLCKLSKKKLEDLDDEMKSFFKRDRKSTQAWENVKDIASSTNSLLNNISGFFKRK